MKKTNIVLFLMLLFSIITEAAITVVSVHAEAKDIQLVDEKWLDLSYTYEKKGESNQWVVSYEQQSEEKDAPRRMKFRVTDEKDQVIAYPKHETMTEKEGWLIEEDFSEKSDGRLVLEVPRAINALHLYVQMDQQSEPAKDGDAPKIHENIVERQAPFVLERTNKATKQATKESTETEQSTDERIGPKKENTPMGATASAAQPYGTSQMYSQLYTNKETKYKHDAGTYPEFSWQPTGQTNVINHQGGVAGQTGWDGVKNWNVANDTYSNSYIKYGGEAAKPNVLLRKYAQETSEPDEFKIKLNVRGNTTYKPGVDIVFLLDNTGSMAGAKKKQSADAMQKIVDKLQEISGGDANSIRVGGHIFASYDKSIEGQWGWTRTKTHHKLSNKPSDWQNMVKVYRNLTPAGMTFTQRGLQEAEDIFNASGSSLGEDRYKLLFVLTDGAPNISWKPTSAIREPSMFYDQTLITGFDSGYAPNYNGEYKFDGSGINTKFAKNFPVNGQPITSHLTTTNSTAYKLKNSGIEIHSLAVQIRSTGDGDHPAATLLEGMYKMATKKANAKTDTQNDYFFYHAKNDTGSLTEYVKSWYDTIIRTVDKGIVIDPLGDMVELVTTNGKAPKVKQVSNSAPAIAQEDMARVQLYNNNRQIELENINLTQNQEIELEYTVKLKTNDSNFVSNRWYPANNKTMLFPTPERTNDEMEFGRPSVRFQKDDFVIPVEKIWSDKLATETDNYWGMRGSKVTAKLQRLAGSMWTDVQSLTLNAANQWKGTFSPVDGSSGNTYRVVEPTRTNGYKKASLNQGIFTSDTMPTGGIKITNELLRGDYSFWKFMGDGKTPFTTDLPKFKVTRSDGKVLAENLTPETGTGKVTIKNMPIGTYTVEETYVPKGFQKMTKFTIEATENNSSAPSSVVFKVNGSTGKHTVRNKLTDFSLIVEKVDDNDAWISGATFKLTGPNYNETIAGGPIFDFMLLQPGKYTLTETDSPNGHEMLKTPITFEIKEDGKCVVDDHRNVTESSITINDENAIYLKVLNKKVRTGVLPQTGAFGVQGLTLIAGILVLGGVMLGMFSLYLDRSKK